MRNHACWSLTLQVLAVRCVSWLLVLSIACELRASQRDENVEAGDILAMAKQNARLPRTLRVTWRIEKGPTEAARRFKSQLVGKLTSAVKADVVPKDQLYKVVSDAAALEQQVKYGKREYADFDYWTDFESFQNRAIRHPDTGGPFGFTEPVSLAFPDRLPNHLEVKESFNDILILSYGPATSRTFRLWQASVNEPRLGVVSIESPWFKEWHPPLIMTSDWGGKKHPIDDLFDMLQNRGGTVLGYVEYAGRSHVLVFTTDGTRSLRAFIDLEQGAVPSRIEQFAWKLTAEELRSRTVSDDDPKLTAQYVATCNIQSKECSQGRYYYPESGEIRMMAMAASAADAISSAQPEMAAHELTTWTYEHLECDREMAENDFRLTFPPDMIYVDKVAKATFMTWDLEGNMQRVADGAIHFGQETNQLRRILGGLALLITISFIGFVFYRRWRRSIA